MEWEWLLQLVIVIVKPLTVSLYSYHKIIDRDGRDQGGAQHNPEQETESTTKPFFVIMIA